MSEPQWWECSCQSCLDKRFTPEEREIVESWSSEAQARRRYYDQESATNIVDAGIAMVLVAAILALGQVLFHVAPVGDWPALLGLVGVFVWIIGAIRGSAEDYEERTARQAQNDIARLEDIALEKGRRLSRNAKRRGPA